MYINVGKKKIEIYDYKTITDKIKSLRFVLEDLDYGIRKKSKHANTYMFCQRVDIIFTDKDNKITSLHENIKSEKLFFDFNATYIYYLPINTIKNLKDKKELKIKEK